MLLAPFALQPPQVGAVPVVFNERSMERLAPVNPLLRQLMLETERRASAQGIDFEITEGMRNAERQAELVAQGASQTMNSRHLTGNAADIHILNPDGSVNWDFEAYRPIADIAKAVATEMGVPDFVWGGDWRTLRDGVHFQIGGPSTPQPPATTVARNTEQAPMAQPMGLLTPTVSANNEPRRPSIWDRIGNVPGLGVLADPEARARMAIALSGMSLNPNQGLIEMNSQFLDDRRDDRRTNQTIAYLESLGRGDLAAAIAAGLPASDALGIALAPPQQAEPTAMMQNYEFLLANGYTPEQALAAVQSGTVVNVGDSGPEVGPIPAGGALVPDPSQPSGFRIEPIPGGPLAAEQAAAEAAAIAADTQTALQGEQGARSANVVIEDINRLADLVENAPWYNPAVGTGSGMLEGLRGTNAADARALSDTISANIAFDRLQAMREASPTGGALGAVTERELALLSSVIGSLDSAQSETQFLQNLERLNTIYGDIIRKFSAYPNAAQFGIVGPEGSIGVTTLPPVRTYNPATGQLE